MAKIENRETQKNTPPEWFANLNPEIIKILKYQNEKIPVGNNEEIEYLIKDPRRKQRGIRYSNRTVCFRI